MVEYFSKSPQIKLNVAKEDNNAAYHDVIVSCRHRPFFERSICRHCGFQLGLQFQAARRFGTRRKRHLSDSPSRHAASEGHSRSASLARRGLRRGASVGGRAHALDLHFGNVWRDRWRQGISRRSVDLDPQTASRARQGLRLATFRLTSRLHPSTRQEAPRTPNPASLIAPPA
jgi:hypothetical protein